MKKGEKYLIISHWMYIFIGITFGIALVTGGFLGFAICLISLGLILISIIPLKIIDENIKIN